MMHIRGKRGAGMETIAPPSNMEAKIGMMVLIVAWQFIQLQAKCTDLGVCQSGDTAPWDFLFSASSDVNEEAVSSGSIAILGGIVVNADSQLAANVYIKDGIITAVGPDIMDLHGARVINATGKYVMPGGIDPHTHLEMPFMGEVACDDFFDGQAAALAGGTTMHIDFALPTNGDLMKGFHEWEKKAAKSCMDYGFHMAITTWNDEVARDMEILARDHGVNSFKFFMAYKGTLMVNDEQLLQGLQKCKEIGSIAQVHAENGDAVALGQERVFNMGITGPEGHALSRPAVLEGEATARAIKLAKFINTPLYVVHVMSKDAMEEVARARQAGQRVIGEAVTSGLALDESRMWDPNFDIAAQYVMSPPIRSGDHGLALQAALSTGILQLVGTDHAVFNSTQKRKGRHDFRLIPNGVNGIEERMHIVWDIMVNSGRITPSDYVRITSTACAQIFNIYPRKGVIAVGSDADIIILNPEGRTTISAAKHHSKMDTNVYQGWDMKGKVEVTIRRGEVVWENDELKVQPGSGRYLPMQPFGPLFHGLEKQDTAARATFQAPVTRSS